MKHINTYAPYAAAAQHLSELRTAHAAALKDDASALASLAQPEERESALAVAARLLRGEQTHGVDAAAQAARLADARQRLRLLAAAIEEQEAVVATTRGTLSVKVCADALPAHLKAAAAIATALEGLRTAVAAEATLRAEISAAGFACNLEPLATPELNHEDSQSAPSRLLRDVRRYIEVCKLRDGKGAAMRLLVDAPGLGVAGDVVKVDGPSAAALMAGGRGEVTDAPPSRAARQAEANEPVLS